MQTIFLSPHFDDVALSCGGIVWQKAQSGEDAGIWTICAGEIPDGPLSEFAQNLHQRWQTGEKTVERRRQEDIASCNSLNARYRHFSIPDCIYRFTETKSSAEGDSFLQREHLYSEQTFLGPLHPAEEALVELLSRKLVNEVPESAQFISPLAIGGHVDHRLVRSAAEKTGRELLYYADYPYCLKDTSKLAHMEQAGWTKIPMQLSQDSLKAWKQGIAAHTSQISTFWSDLADMAKSIEKYYYQLGGSVLWQAPRKTKFV